MKNLPAMWETWVRSLGWEDPLEKGMATHSSLLAWTIPWTEEPGRRQFMGHKELDMTERLHTYSCLWFKSKVLILQLGQDLHSIILIKDKSKPKYLQERKALKNHGLGEVVCPVQAPQRWEGDRKETAIWGQEWFPTGLCKEASALKQLLCARNCAKQFHVNFIV